MTIDDMLVSTGDAAKMLGVSPQTIRNYIAEGYLKVALTLPSGDFRLWKSDILAWGGHQIRLSDAKDAK